MSPKLKPLLLPQKVESDKLEEQRQSLKLAPEHETYRSTPIDGLCSQPHLVRDEIDETSYLFTYNSSASDIACPSPVTPTFSRSGQSRFSGSSSSLELPISPTSEAPTSPTQIVHLSAKVASKRQLADVQEEPVEKDDEQQVRILEATSTNEDMLSEQTERESFGMSHSTFYGPQPIELDEYDLGFLSDNDYTAQRSPKKRRGESGTASPLTTWSARVETRLNSLARWRSFGRSRTTGSFYQASEYPDEFHSTVSRTASSRSSSRSVPVRRHTDRTSQPPVPPIITAVAKPTASPALSRSGSVDGYVVTSITMDDDQPDTIESIERDRALAVTPLLPPLTTELQTSSHVASLHPSPLQSPKIVDSSELEAAFGGPVVSPLPSPPLSSRPSFANFSAIPLNVTATRLSRTRANSLNVEPSGPLSSLPPNILELGDAWSDRLGHANFTIMPRPYEPEEASMDILRVFRSDWDRAKASYTKHLIRTGEHYGPTSTTYAMTEAKWAEIESHWQSAQANLVERVAQSGDQAALASLQWHQQLQDDLAPTSPGAVPNMLDGSKFPDRGDEDVVGPMQRDCNPARESAPVVDDRTDVLSSHFWKTLGEKLKGRR
jgi:hypothetical protein